MNRFISYFLFLICGAAVMALAGCKGGAGTEAGMNEDGSLCGVFAVSDTKNVVFSRGNLQYRASDDTWQFAGEQYEFLGTLNSQISKDDTSFIDLFGWGTSGKQGKMPYTNTLEASDYATEAIAGTELDWGVNKIQNGKGRQWRTLTHDEWDYLLHHAQYAQGKVCSINGLILLPEKAQLPAGIDFKKGTGDWLLNQYNKEQWTKLQAAGAVFLPAAGSRDPFMTTIVADTTEGHYWASTLHGHNVYNATEAYSFDFDGDYVKWATAKSHTDEDSYRTPENGLAVRLVSDN